MTERKMVNETTRIIGLYETLSITDFIFKLKELEKDGWESVEIDVEEQYDGNSITLRALKKRPLRDRFADVIEGHLDVVEYAVDVDSYALAQDLLNHIAEWVPDYSHNDEVTVPENVTIHNLEDFKKGWDAHAAKTFKTFDW